MASYLLKEDAGKIILEAGGGDLLLEISVPSVLSPAVDDGAWYMYAQQLAQQSTAAKRPVPILLPRFSLPPTAEEWTEEELAFLLAVDVLA